MARVVYGDNATFRQLEQLQNPYANQMQSLTNWAVSTYQNIFGGVQNAITDAITTVNTYVQNSGAYQEAVNIMRTLQSAFLPNAICYLTETWQVQHAPLPMIRGIMANPNIQSLYFDGRIQGYGDNYSTIYTSAPEPTEHRDYMLVNNGLVLESTNPEDDWDWECVSYSDNLYEEDAMNDLTIDQQHDIRHAWTIADSMIEAGYDPTDEYNGEIA